MPDVIKEYIAAQPTEIQPTLWELAETIRRVAPNANERISYRMPCFYIGKTFLCGFAVFKKHIGFYPGGEAIGVFAKRLEGYKTSTGAVRFPRDRSVDFVLIADIIRWRLDLKIGKK
jgi:uncharacterized protein YdhG (YjbR/CyaY superfamily)